ncbi:MAG TPA: PAS domain S-box protein, partial [Burkholderiales bacterium]|nr:PAS domain S-box protein [Burkholderiales bacterium]
LDERTAARAGSFDPYRVRGLVCVPCVTESGAKAALSVQSTHARKWRPDEVQLVRDVAARLFPAVERARTQEALRASEERFRMTFDSMAIGMAHVSVDGVWLRVNDRLCAITGRSREELLGTSFGDITHPDDVEKDLALARRVISGAMPSYTIDKRYVRKNGSVVWAEISVALLRDARMRPMHFIVSVADISERKKAEAALHEADRRKDEFLATLAHELRNPLAPIRNAVQILNLQGAQDATSQAARNIIERQLQHMVRLIDDLLDVSRITRGKLELRRSRVALDAVIAQALETARPQIEQSGHELTLSWPPQPVFIDGDAARLAQVFANLLNNACSYTPKGGEIGLTVEPADGRVLVTVRDSGIGISAECMPHVFDMFSGVAPAGHAKSGLGIGLSLAKALVEMHGGRIEARSEGPGKGSEFVVALPTVAAPEVPAPEEVAPDAWQGLTGHRVLVADDNRDSAHSLATLLTMSGNDVVTAYDGREAVQKAAEYRPGVALLDIGMPIMDGYDACRAIRAQPWGKDIVVVALTGWGQRQDRDKTKAAGFDGHLVKPLDYRALSELLDSLTAKA